VALGSVLSRPKISKTFFLMRLRSSFKKNVLTVKVSFLLLNLGKLYKTSMKCNKKSNLVDFMPERFIPYAPIVGNKSANQNLKSWLESALGLWKEVTLRKILIL
jgi:hypothetical protein